MRSRSIIAPLILAGAVLAACSDDDGGGGKASTEYSAAGSLRHVPAAAVDPDSTSLVMSGDVDEATKLAGLERPTDPGSDATIAWLQAITGVTKDGELSDVGVMPLDQLRLTEGNRMDEISDELGWSMIDVHTYAGVDAPPEHFISMTGDFEEKAIDAAQGDRTDDIWSLGGDDFSVSLQDRTTARPLGQSVRTALHDGRLAESVSTPTMTAWLSGKDTLADDDSLLAVAEALDDKDVYSAAFVLGDAGDTRGSTPRSSAGGDDSGLAPFDALGLGSAHDDDRGQLVLAYHCDSDAGATQNAEALRTLFEDGESVQSRRPFSDLFEVDDVDVDGRVVTVTLGLLDHRSPAVGLQMVVVREPFTVSP